MGLSLNFQLICFFMIIALVANAQAQSKVFNVKDFGAVPDGKTDNAKAFGESWKQACSYKGESRLVIPKGTYLTNPVTFKGPCNGAITFQLQGVIKAPSDLSSSDSWISFNYINNLHINGGGSFDGQGALAWKNNKCSKNWNCKLTISVRFNFVTDSTVSDISSVDSKAFHINVFGCKNLKFQSVKIIAPGYSTNTDGIHVGESTGIKISNSEIGTGDDCISLGPGSNDISISNVQCGPGHGISIGSLGKYKNEESVSGIVVRDCKLTGTDNGVRIKTWPSSPNGMASNFTFEGLIMNNVSNPIIIDQAYCPHANCDLKSPSRVQIKQVRFKNIRGTSASPVAVSLLCSKGFPCQDVELSDINLKYIGKEGPTTKSSCANVNPIVSGNVFPPACV